MTQPEGPHAPHDDPRETSGDEGQAPRDALAQALHRAWQQALGGAKLQLAQTLGALTRGHDLSWALAWLPVWAALGRLGATLAALARDARQTLRRDPSALSLSPEDRARLMEQLEQVRQAAPEAAHALLSIERWDALYQGWLQDEASSKALLALLEGVEARADALLEAAFEALLHAPAPDPAQTLKRLEALEATINALIADVILPRLMPTWQGVSAHDDAPADAPQE